MPKVKCITELNEVKHIEILDDDMLFAHQDSESNSIMIISLKTILENTPQHLLINEVNERDNCYAYSVGT